MKTCAACGAPIVEYRHRFNAVLASALWKLGRQHDYGDEAHLSDLGLTYSERCNFQKLRYWGFVMQGSRRGHWLMRPAGRWFLRGLVTAPAEVWTYRGEFVRSGEERVKFVDYDEYIDQREDYAQAAEAH